MHPVTLIILESQAAAMRSKMYRDIEKQRSKAEKDLQKQNSDRNRPSKEVAKFTALQDELEKIGRSNEAEEALTTPISPEEKAEYGSVIDVYISRLENILNPGQGKFDLPEMTVSNVDDDLAAGVEHRGRMDLPDSRDSIDHNIRRLKHMVLLLKNKVGITTDELTALFWRLGISPEIIRDAGLREIPSNAANDEDVYLSLPESQKDINASANAQGKVQAYYLHALEKIKSMPPELKNSFASIVKDAEYKQVYEAILNTDILIMSEGSYRIINKGRKIIFEVER